MNPLRALFPTVLAALLLALPGGAAADEAGQAQARFDEGLALLREQRFAEACPKLEESVRLDPLPGSKFRLAECYEGLGRLAAAFKMYREVEVDTRLDERSDREARVRARLDALEPKLAWLSIKAPEAMRSTADFAVTADGLALTPEELRALKVPIEAGPRRFVISAAGHRSIERTLVFTAGATIALDVPMLEKAPAEPPAQDGAPAPGPTPALPPSPPAAPARPDARPVLTPPRIAGLALFGLSAGSLAAGAALGFVSKGQWEDAEAGCAGSHDRCPDAAIALGDDAFTSAVASTALFVGAGVTAAGGIVLWAIPTGASDVALRAAPLGVRLEGVF